VTTLGGQLVLLVVFSLALAAVVSAYREDEPRRVLRGTLHRAALFLVAVVLLDLLILGVDALFLRPGS